MIMVKLENRNDDGTYETEENLMMDTYKNWDSETCEYSYCGMCGQLLGKPKDIDQAFDDFKKIMTGIY